MCAGLLKDWRFFVRIKLEAVQQIIFDVTVPVTAKRGEIFQRVAHGHPWIKRDHVRHICQPRFDGNFIALRVKAEHAHRAGIGPEQIQQTFDGRGFARAIATKKAVASAGADIQRETVHGIVPAVTPREILNFNNGRIRVHRMFGIRVAKSRR